MIANENNDNIFALKKNVINLVRGEITKSKKCKKKKQIS